MTTPNKSQWPGREVPNPTLRAVAQSAVRQGWRYNDGLLFPPDGSAPVKLPTTPQWKAMNRAITALAAHGLETVRPVYDAAPADNDGPGINPEEIGPAGNYADELLRKLSEASVPPRAQGDGRYSLADARDLLRQGYSLEHVCGATGWGRMWLQDLADRLAAS